LKIKVIKTEKNIKNFYNQLLLPMFIDDEIDSLDNFISYTKNQTKLCKFNILVSTCKQKFYGGVVFDYYKDINCILIEYISTLKEFRGIGIASNFIDTIQKKYKVNYIIIEVENPQIISTDEAKNRFLFWQNRGFRIVDFKYIQPPLDDNKNQVEHMLIMCKTFSSNFEETLPANILQTALKNYFMYSMNIKEDNIKKFLNIKQKNYLLINKKN